MKTSDFSFELPRELIAQHPPERRGDSRLMVIDPRSFDGRRARPHGSSGRNEETETGMSVDEARPAGMTHQPAIEHRMIADLPDLLEPGTVMVVNDSKVRRARVFAHNEHGGKVELLLVDPLPNERWRAVVSRARKQQPGKTLYLEDGITARIESIEGELRIVAFDRNIDDDWLDRHGHVPLPPYIDREDEPTDADRYQTVYADKTGSVAAPTAGLHLTDELIERIRDRGVLIESVTLHVGLGTFRPIRSETVEQHEMHEESYEVPVATSIAVNRARREGRTVLAVGTTSMRTLESAWGTEGLRPGNSTTRLYIYPGYSFKVVDALLTNFHTPGSTLLVLVSAFAGTELVQRSYEEAVRNRYRFFSYGDAMLIRSRR